jgi:hypothetical protein
MLADWLRTDPCSAQPLFQLSAANPSGEGASWSVTYLEGARTGSDERALRASRCAYRGRSWLGVAPPIGLYSPLVPAAHHIRSTRCRRDIDELCPVNRQFRSKRD